MYAKDQLHDKLKPFHYGDGREDRSVGVFLAQTIVQFISLFGIVVCVTSLYLAMRGVMRLGGMVASGGPYAIAHPAPGWAWLFPVSMLAGVVFIGLNVYASHRVGGLDALVFAWPAVFLSLGWNFLEFAFKGNGGHGIVWGWLICGIIFAPMGIVPLLFIISNAVKALSGRTGSSMVSPWSGDDNSRSRGSRVRLGRTGRVVLILVQLAACGLGVFGGERFFEMLSVEKGATSVKATGAAAAPRSLYPPPSSSASRRMALPLVAHSPRIVITYEHNTIEIQSGESRVFYNGRSYGNPRELPLEARQVLEQTVDLLTVLLKY